MFSYNIFEVQFLYNHYEVYDICVVASQERCVGTIDDCVFLKIPN